VGGAGEILKNFAGSVTKLLGGVPGRESGWGVGGRAALGEISFGVRGRVAGEPIVFAGPTKGPFFGRGPRGILMAPGWAFLN